jgi:16S rRNA (guanine966-N2)-methyltransferase
VAERVVRIIAGRAKGRRLEVPKSGTRPLTGKAREAVFSSLAARMPDADVLDLYAGSGSLGLEALSRGAASCVFVERDRGAAGMLTRNIDAVGLGGSVVVSAVDRFLPADQGLYDVVFLDPPYADPDEEVAANLGLVVERLRGDAVVVLHRRIGANLGPVEKLSVRDERRYGDARIWVLEKEDA